MEGSVMTDNIETMRGVIADALSNPAGTCANSCEGNAYQIEIRRLIADRAKLEERLEKAEQALSRAGFVRNELYGEWKPPVNRVAAKLRWRIAELESQLQAAWEQAPVNARLLEALKAAKVALQKVVEDCGGCEHEAGVCVCPELAAISQSGEAIAAAESQHAGPVRLMDSDTHAKDLRQMARKIGHPAGDVPAVMRAAADRIDELERLVAAFQRAEAGDGK